MTTERQRSGRLRRRGRHSQIRKARKVFDALESRLQIVVLNSCRDNPARCRVTAAGAQQNQATQTVDPDTGEILTP
ncbi:hypothetical protein [Rhizobium leguminosarum]|uniref:hypothetical protein n=1 Tax=Rhizobium leguminosarum TaxID=384 RepID=UPI001C970F40|nr:hypothetical protein [Rhizobium leguminosarum]MBY5562593.1 hypothetical protein [Rhizobium leguminosarum]MBY5710200.1 hypothetical protein [Rhizobium leguminosarum]MBY5758561.1 hypothetical protein [Rhizobium leguminosarum]